MESLRGSPVNRAMLVLQYRNFRYHGAKELQLLPCLRAHTQQGVIMTYNGMKLNEFNSDKPVLFGPPKQMLCWDDEDWHEPTTDYMGLED